MRRRVVFMIIAFIYIACLTLFLTFEHKEQNPNKNVTTYDNITCVEYTND